MRAVFKNLVVPLMVCDTVVVAAIAIMYLMGHNAPFGPEGMRCIHLALVIGVVMVLACWPVCRLLRPVPGTIVGLAFGLVTPAVVGWLWASLVEYFEYYTFGAWARDWALDPGWAFWIAAIYLTGPGGIAGAVVGFLQAKRAGRGPSGHSKCETFP
jgi:hypothetical protein